MRSTSSTLPTSRSLPFLAAAALLLSGGCVVRQAPGTTADRQWVGTWAASPQGRAVSDPPAIGSFRDQTVRQIVRVSMGGDTVRVRFSNELGRTSLVIGAASVAISAGGASIDPETSRPLTFGGASSITVPPGAPALSDPVALHVPPLARLAISLYLPDSTETSTYHPLSVQTSYVSTPGDHTNAVAMPVDTTAVNWFFLSGVSVRAPTGTAAIVTLGNSITDGYASTPDADARWPNVLARHLEDQGELDRLSVLNEGISGNRVLHDGTGRDALARFDQDVLRQPGVGYVIVLEGINDIGDSMFRNFRDQEVSAEDLIAGYRQLIARTHQMGLRIYGATLTPYEGCGYYSPEGEAKRQAINQWIRTSGEYDGVIDFDEVTRDPAHPSRFLPKYDSGDHLHPSDAGYEAMGMAVDLGLFAESGAATR